MFPLLLTTLLVFSPLQGGEDSATTNGLSISELPAWLPHAERGEALYLQGAIVESNALIADLEDRLLILEKTNAASKASGADTTESGKNVERLGHEINREHLNLEENEARLTELTSLLSLANIWLWLQFHGPPVLGILLMLAIGLQLANYAGRAILKRANNDGEHGDSDERIQRAETLVLVFRKAASIALWSICIIAILGELGVNTTALAAALGLFGIAISLGSQGLVKDFVSGFFMLLENQLAIGDVISINGSISGTVENFGMRVTVLRDGSGTLHFIPNGSISRVSNQTHGFSKTVFTIGAGYREDPDEVIEVIESVLAKFAEDPNWKELLLEEPSVLGVDSLGESEVSFKLSLKVSPGKQWGIRRELLKRLKIAFDLNDIEMPFPQRVHYTEATQPVPKTVQRREKVN